MSIKFELSCAMCGKVKEFDPPMVWAKYNMPLKTVVESAKWIWQQNGPNFDIYCCKRCAL